MADTVVILDHNYRASAALAEVARRVNAQDAAVVGELPRWTPAQTFDAARGCWLADDDGPNALRSVLEPWVEEHFLSGGDDNYASIVARCAQSDTPPDALLTKLFDKLEAARVLTLLREGPSGAAGINALCERLLRARLDPRGGGPFFAGAPLLIAKNDYAHQLFNGDIGIVLRSGDAYRAVFRATGGYALFPLDVLPPHELAFALTVHKSQGSAYERVLLVLPTEDTHRLLSKEILYTAITRAKELVVMLGAKTVAEQAICRGIEREPVVDVWTGR